VKIGVVSMYPFRPHVQDLIYLSEHLEKEGHTCYYLTCGASLPTCYYNLFKGEVKSLVQCSKCHIGGLGSYKNKNITFIDKNLKADLSEGDVSYIIKSTIGSLGRVENEFETESILSDNIKEKLIESVEIVYQNTINWVFKEKLDGVLLFNGRYDTPRAVMLALKSSNVPFISIENHLNGIILNYNEDCLSLKFVSNINRAFRDVPLNKQQASFAGKIIGEMFSKKQKIWRTHNSESINANWPIKSEGDKRGVRVLITPSSKFEFLGNQEWEVEWTKDYTEGYEKVIRSLGVDFKDCVLRCHPFWNENLANIGKGDKSEKHYTSWAKSRGIHVIESKDNRNTLDLIKEADIILVNGGTAGIEAALMGKTVISIGKSRYYEAGFTITAFNEDDLENILSTQQKQNASYIQRRAVRYIYNYHGRFEQFYDVIDKQTPLENSYYTSNEVAKRIVRIFKEGKIEPYETEISDEVEYENEIIELINNNNWDELLSLNYNEFNHNNYEAYKIKKRGMYQIVDTIRRKLPAGHY
jgi:hypothetical protein